MDIWQEEYDNPKASLERLYLRRQSGDNVDRDRLRWYYSNEAGKIIAERRKVTEGTNYWRFGWNMFDAILPMRLYMRLWSQGFGRKYEATLLNRRDRRLCKEVLHTRRLRRGQRRSGWWVLLHASPLPWLD